MRKWLIPIVAASLTYATAVPALADISTTTDTASLYSDINTPSAGMSTTLHINVSSTSDSAPTVQIKTSLGSLNDQGSSIDLTPVDGVYPSFSLSSTKAGTATVGVYENGVLIGSQTVTFQASSLGLITVLATPSTAVVGGASTITIKTTDLYGNPVADGSSGTTFTLTTTDGVLTPAVGTTVVPNTSTLTVSTHNGVATVNLTDLNAGTVNVTVGDLNPIPSDVKFNGNLGISAVTLPVTFNYSQTVSTVPFTGFNDISGRSDVEQASERELYLTGVLHGDPNHFFYPDSTMKRSEFAEVVAQYMGLGSLATIMNGTQTRFNDVKSDAWYDGAVAAISSLGYMKGDGAAFYPDNTISYAEVAQVLLNNLGIQSSGSWPDAPIYTAQANHLFDGVGSFSVMGAAKRGEVAIMVRNALHTNPPGLTDGITGGSIRTWNPNKSLESQSLGFAWNGETQPTSVLAVPGNGVNVGNEIQVLSGNQTVSLPLVSPLTLVGATNLSDLMDKNIKYLTNSVGMVIYIEVTQ